MGAEAARITDNYDGLAPLPKGLAYAALQMSPTLRARVRRALSELMIGVEPGETRPAAAEPVASMYPGNEHGEYDHTPDDPRFGAPNTAHCGNPDAILDLWSEAGVLDRHKELPKIT